MKRDGWETFFIGLTGFGFVVMAIVALDWNATLYAFTGMLVWAVTLQSHEGWRNLAVDALRLVDLCVQDMKERRA